MNPEDKDLRFWGGFNQTNFTEKLTENSKGDGIQETLGTKQKRRERRRRSFFVFVCLFGRLDNKCKAESFHHQSLVSFTTLSLFLLSGLLSLSLSLAFLFYRSGQKGIDFYFAQKQRENSGGSSSSCV